MIIWLINGQITKRVATELLWMATESEDDDNNWLVNVKCTTLVLI